MSSQKTKHSQSLQESTKNNSSGNVRKRKSKRLMKDAEVDHQTSSNKKTENLSELTTSRTSTLEQSTTTEIETQTSEPRWSENVRVKKSQLSESRTEDDEVTGIIKRSIEDIEQNKEDLRENNRLGTERKLKQLIKMNAGFTQKCKEEEEFGKRDRFYFKMLTKEKAYFMIREHFNKIFAHILPWSAADLVFYYLMKNEQPTVLDTKTSSDQTSQFYHSDEWYELCSFMLLSIEFKNQFYERLGKNSAALEHLIHKHPQLLFTKWTNSVVRTLSKYLPFERLHHVMMTIRNDSSQTALFSISILAFTPPFIKHYQLHTDELYQLLSLQDKHDQTALHVNQISICQLLRVTYIPKYRDELLKLVSITDKNNQTALQTVDGIGRDTFRSILDQVENNRYILYFKPNVLIIYNTNNRPGAEGEARTIYDAFNSTQRFNTKLEKDKNEEEVIQLIKDSAEEEYRDLPQSALIVVLLSHGSLGVIYDYNNKPMKLKSVESAMCQTVLQNRPKILITQCCQHNQGASVSSEKLDPGLKEASSVRYTPTNADFCAVMSTVSGEPSQRRLFIPKFAEQIKNCKPNETIGEFVENVSQQFAAENKSQKPITHSTLRAKFCLMTHSGYTIELKIN